MSFAVAVVIVPFRSRFEHGSMPGRRPCRAAVLDGRSSVGLQIGERAQNWPIGLSPNDGYRLKYLCRVEATSGDLINKFDGRGRVAVTIILMINEISIN
jgi:hypothetical protein